MWKSDEQTEWTRKMGTDSQMESRMTAGEGGQGVEGLSKKEKGLMYMDHSMVIAGEGEYKGTKL